MASAGELSCGAAGESCRRAVAVTLMPKRKASGGRGPAAKKQKQSKYRGVTGTGIGTWRVLFECGGMSVGLGTFVDEVTRCAADRCGSFASGYSCYRLAAR